ncbi:MAG: 3-deoxy-manno-octulosonate cytidylyltransferase, partial [Gammaproteobacteria bacterium]|nr:3-deoxy-manno-octulosonate cytidylyltransferase [Gammaproteobacteria bacterium]
LLESLEQLRALHHGINIAVAPCDEMPGVGVDVIEDLKQVEQILLRES